MSGERVIDQLEQSVILSRKRSTSSSPPFAACWPRPGRARPRSCACAVPRWFDLAVLAVLRGRADGNERVLELLRGYSFVRPLGAGRFAYSDEVRAALLEEWRAERPDELRALNQRLAAHFAGRAAPTAEQQRSPDAAIAIQPGGDWALWRREALYHQLMLDPRAGMAQLRAEFDQAEAGPRLADCEALLQTALEAPLDARDRLWLRYLRARLDRLALRLPAASEQLGRSWPRPISIQHWRPARARPSARCWPKLASGPRRPHYIAAVWRTSSRPATGLRRPN